MDNEIISMLGEEVSRFADQHYPFHERHGVLNLPKRYSESVWTNFAELGWLAISVPEDQDGLGGDPRAVATVMETVGRRLLMEPIFSSAIVATSIVTRLASERQRQEWLPSLIDGSMVAVFAADVLQDHEPCQWRDQRLSGRRAGVLHGDSASMLLVPAVNEQGHTVIVSVLTDAEGLERHAYELVDGRGAAMMTLHGVRGEVLDGDSDVECMLGQIRAEAATALCAETLGITRTLVNATVEYLKVRKQFGVAIGTFQALQHRAVEMQFLLEEIKALTVAAQQALIGVAADRDHVVSGCRSYIIEAARKIANEAVQMHGGLGVTEELNVTHYFRRLMVMATLFGDREDHFKRFAASFNI
jgi:alkylation response protein AidB-like acyl-CoA dehydrogenase